MSGDFLDDDARPRGCAGAMLLLGAVVVGLVVASIVLLVLDGIRVFAQ